MPQIARDHDNRPEGGTGTGNANAQGPGAEPAAGALRTGGHPPHVRRSS